MDNTYRNRIFYSSYKIKTSKMKDRDKIKTSTLLPSAVYTGCQSSNAW